MRRALSDARARRLQGDEGVGLIEVLITVSLLGIAFVSILGALAVVSRTSRIHQVSADANTVLVGAAEAVKALDFCDPDESCDPMTTYESGLDAVDLPTGWERENVHIDSVTPVTGAGRLVHDVTLELVSPDSEITETLTVSKVSPPPPPPVTVPIPTDQCTAATVTARAFSLIIFAIVEVTIPADADACTTPIRAKVVGGPNITLSQSSPTRWSGVGFSGLCVGTCQIDIMQADGTLIMTVPVESFF
jgi:type II secretory pathway pseudopilin PulG